MSSVGYVGGGDQALSYQRAASELGVELVVVDPDQVRSGLTVVIVGPGCDHRSFTTLLQTDKVTLRPSPSTIRVAHDPLAARYELQECVYDFADFEEIDSGDTEAVNRFAHHYGWPVRLRAAHWGITAPAVHLLRPYTRLDPLWAETIGQLWLLEAYEPIATRVSVAIARRPSGQHVICSVAATVARDCRPHQRLPLAASISDRATTTASSIVEGLDAAGIVTVSFLHSHDGRLLVDDITYGPVSTLVTGAATEHSLYALQLGAILDMPFDSRIAS